MEPAKPPKQVNDEPVIEKKESKVVATEGARNAEEADQDKDTEKPVAPANGLSLLHKVAIGAVATACIAAAYVFWRRNR